MELNISQDQKQLISGFLLIVLPWIIMGLGLVTGMKAVAFYIPMILWFGIGIIFYQALN